MNLSSYMRERARARVDLRLETLFEVRAWEEKLGFLRRNGHDDQQDGSSC